VATTGSDSNTGASPSAPLKTPSAARDRARTLRNTTTAAVTVHLATGMYTLANPLLLDERDANTFWSGDPNAKVRSPVAGGPLDRC
jgi:transcriptional regulator GlxA family with amidase domain